MASPGSYLRALPFYVWVVVFAASYLYFSVPAFTVDMSGQLATFLVEAFHFQRFFTFIVLPAITLAIARLYVRTQNDLVKIRCGPAPLSHLFAGACVIQVTVLAVVGAGVSCAFVVSQLLGHPFADHSLLPIVIGLEFGAQFLYFLLLMLGYVLVLTLLRPWAAYVSVFVWVLVFAVGPSVQLPGGVQLFAPMFLDVSPRASVLFQSLVAAGVWLGLAWLLSLWRRRGWYNRFFAEGIVCVPAVVCGGLYLGSLAQGVSAREEINAAWLLRGYYQDADIFGSGLLYTLFLAVGAVMATSYFTRRVGDARLFVEVRGGLSASSLVRALFRQLVVPGVLITVFLLGFMLIVGAAARGDLALTLVYPILLFAIGFVLTAGLAIGLGLWAELFWGYRFFGVWVVLVGYFGLGVSPLASWLPWFGITPYAGLAWQFVSLGLLTVFSVIAVFIFLKQLGALSAERE